MANLAGKAIKGYELLERIGAGGFGAVYRAYQSTLGREVAVKVILPGYANRSEFIRRFEIEAQLVARLEHLHIVPLYDYWRDADGAYLVMRWMRGGSLQGALQEGPLNLGPAALLLDQVASGLVVAHSQGVIHCDLKPPNILLDEEGNAYLADFSIARILRHAESSLVPKDTGDNSLDSISPEQIRGEPVTPQTDIYGLGVLVYEILNGQPPFPKMTRVQRLYKHLNDPLPRLEGLSETVQEGINHVIQKATAKNPKRRFGDALEMAAAFRLAAHLDDQVVQTEALTAREEEVLLRIVDGLSNKEIAQELFIELTTVKWYITQIYRKLGVRSRKQAIARAQEARLLATDETDEPAAPTVNVALPEPVNPYKGLRAFDVSDARDFFGREDEIEKVIARLALASASSKAWPGNSSPGAGRFLAIVGPSGSGKSSLVKAGLIPALSRGEAPGSDRWFIVQFVSGARPLDHLEIALARVAADQSANLRRHLERDEHGLLRVAELMLPQNDSELLLVIDQFEELFTLVEDEVTQAHFLALLATAVCDLHSRVRVILTLRADYYDRPLHHPHFGELLRNQMETILPLSAAALERAIVRPAARVGVSFEPGLVARMIDDTQYQPGALPLLQYALTELFDAREERLLTHKAYEAIGGLTGALARRAEEPYLEQDRHGREAIRQLFLRLVDLDDSAIFPDTRLRVPRSELIAVAADEEVMDELVDTYAAYRLLTLDHEPDSRRPTVEIAHEALLREWQRLRGWLDESRADLRLRRQLARAAVEWRQAGQDSSFLLRGSRLDQFEVWSQATRLALTAGERDYLQASTALRDERAAADAARQAREAKLEQRARRVLQALAVVFLLAALTGGWFALEANRQRREAERSFARSESQRLAAEANYVLQRGGSAELAALLALRGLNAGYTSQADLVLQRAAGFAMGSTLIEAPGGAFWPLVSPDNRYLRFMRDDPGGSAGQIIELWDLQVMERLWEVRNLVMLGYPWTIRDYTADGSLMMAIPRDAKGLALLDVQTGKLVRTFTVATSEIIHPQLSPNGEIIVVGTAEGDVIVMNAGTGDEIRRFAVGGEGYTRFIAGRELLVGISPDSRLVAATAAGRTHVWDLESGSELHRFEHEHHGKSPPQFVNGGRLLIAAVEPVLSLWDLSTGQEVEHDIPPGGAGILSPDGRFYAQGLGGESGKEIILWEVATGMELHRLAGHTAGQARPVEFTNDSRQVVTGASDGTARLWDVASGRELLVLAAHTQPLQGADLSPDGRYLITTGRDDAVRIWDLQPLLRQDSRIDGAHTTLHLSPDRRVALTVDPETGLADLVDAGTFALRHHLDFVPDPVIDGSTARPPFSGDGQMVLGVKDLETILVYDVASGELIAEHANPDGVYKYASFVPGSRRIFAGGDRGAYLLDAKSGEQLRVFETPGSFVYESLSGLVAVSPDGRYGALHVWTTDSLNVVYLWELETGVLEFQSPPHPSDLVVAFAFSKDNHYFAWGGTNNVVYVLDLNTMEQVTRLSHLNSIHGIDFSSDNRLLLTSTGGDGVILWDLESGEVVRRFYGGAGQVGFVAFVENDNSILYTTLEDGVIHRQPVNIEELIETTCARLLRDLTPAERQLYELDDTSSCPKFAHR